MIVAVATATEVPDTQSVYTSAVADPCAALPYLDRKVSAVVCVPAEAPDLTVRTAAPAPPTAP